MPTNTIMTDPVAGGRRGWPFSLPLTDLASVAYVADEFFSTAPRPPTRQSRATSPRSTASGESARRAPRRSVPGCWWYDRRTGHGSTASCTSTGRTLPPASNLASPTLSPSSFSTASRGWWACLPSVSECIGSLAVSSSRCAAGIQNVWHARPSWRRLLLRHLCAGHTLDRPRDLGRRGATEAGCSGASQSAMRLPYLRERHPADGAALRRLRLPPTASSSIRTRQEKIQTIAQPLGAVFPAMLSSWATTGYWDRPQGLPNTSAPISS